MIPSINFVLAGPIAMALAICLGGVVAGAVLSAGLIPPSSDDIANFAKIGLTVAAVYLWSWVENEWKSFDQKVQEEEGSYIPIEEKAEEESDENIFETMARCATFPLSVAATTEDDDTATQTSALTEPETTEVAPRLSTRSSFSEANLWQTVLANGTTFHQVSRRSFVLESST